MTIRIAENGVLHDESCGVWQTPQRDCTCRAFEHVVQDERRVQFLHAWLGGLGIWVHHADPNGLPGLQRQTFYTFKVEDVHNAIDNWAKRTHMVEESPPLVAGRAYPIKDLPGVFVRWTGTGWEEV